MFESLPSAHCLPSIDTYSPTILALPRYHSSILYIKRNILTYLSLILVISMNLISNATVRSM